MTPRYRLSAGITALISAAAVMLAVAPAAAAATAIVSPGDRIDYLSPTAATQFCTIGYVYTGTDSHTYAITAGHCRTTATGQARDKRTAWPARSSAQSWIHPTPVEPTTASSISAAEPGRCRSSATHPSPTRTHAPS